MRTKIEFPTEWTMPDPVEDEDGRADEPQDGDVNATGANPPGVAVVAPTTGLIVPHPHRIARHFQVSGG